REREEDVLPLARHYLAHYRARYQKAVTGFDRGAEQTLLAHIWPGNVRELGHAIERGVLMAAGSEMTARDLGLQAAPSPAGSAEDMTLDQAERLFIQKVLARHGGDVRKAADQLGMSRSALYRRLQQHGL